MSLEKVPASVKELAAAINNAIAFDEDGTATLPETFFSDNLPEGLDIETVKRSQQAEVDFTDALVIGLGEKSIPHLKANKALDRTSVTASMGFSEVRASVDRKVDVRAPGQTETKPKYGAASVKLTVSAGQKRGNLKRAMEHINAQGIEHLSN